ncbi:Molybdopterin-guanine dinucleotide biosynthesis protein A [Rubellimicrobium thermophilum DSM 16684]|uniref:Molybdopterin-guanine dinucleotide biosynthesis protein A n=1 Tax=Rubellimicrobium thermophilum DSM 16684 TaxID=1123069 RepID=S9QSE6_9RHOB|nr:Molybdopterin-guanine dinucleotide biosynthesis protein A [Rubellimicrobium thermophilum DSM 16684]
MERPPAVILAGGLGRRMGGDKALRPFLDATLLHAVLERIAPQAGPLAINANDDPGRLAAFGLPVLADPLPGRPGPLAGVLAALDWAAAVGAPAVLTVPCDAPSCRPIWLPA